MLCLDSASKEKIANSGKRRFEIARQLGFPSYNLIVVWLETTVETSEMVGQGLAEESRRNDQRRVREFSGHPSERLSVFVSVVHIQIMSSTFSTQTEQGQRSQFYQPE